MPDNLAMRGGSVLYVRGAPQSALGIIFVLFGAFALAVGTGLVPMENPDDFGPVGLSLFVAFGLVFSLVGFYQAFWTSHTVLDRGRGVVVYRQGLFGWGRSRAMRLDRFTHVELGFTEGDSDSSDVFTISLLGAEDTPALALCRSFQMEIADAQSKVLATFLELPILDQTLGAQAHVPEPHVKKPFARSKPVLPAGSQLEVKDFISSVEIRLPPLPFAAAVVFPTAMPILFLVFVLWDQILRQPLTGVVIAALWMVMIMIGKWRRGRARAPQGVVLSISDQVISLRDDMRFAAQLHIPVADIRSLSLHIPKPDDESWHAPWGNYIVVQTAKERHQIARGLSAADTQFIYDILKSTV